VRRRWRFVLDHDVDIAVGRLLRKRGHQCWSVASAGLAAAEDLGIAAYAARRGAVLISHDQAFAERRMRHTTGQHVWLHCRQIVAVELLDRYLSEVEMVLRHMQDVVIEVTIAGVTSHPPSWR
jgi:predicted nuclease of predicted toxin-antitoxin system